MTLEAVYLCCCFMYLVVTRMLGDSYRRRFRSLLFCSCDVFSAIINYFCWLRQTFLDYRLPDSYLSLSCRIVGYIILSSQYGLLCLPSLPQLVTSYLPARSLMSPISATVGYIVLASTDSYVSRLCHSWLHRTCQYGLLCLPQFVPNMSTDILDMKLYTITTVGSIRLASPSSSFL